MIQRPPRSTRTYTLFPYTTRFRSPRANPTRPGSAYRWLAARFRHLRRLFSLSLVQQYCGGRTGGRAGLRQPLAVALRRIKALQDRSEERRVGKECGSTCKTRRSQVHSKENKRIDTIYIRITKETKTKKK